MITKKTYTPVNSPLKEQHDHYRRWTHWLIPKPFDLVSSLLLFGVLVPFLYDFAHHSGYNPPIVIWQAILMAITITTLLFIDRFEYSRYGRETPLKAMLCLIATRLVLIETASWLDQFRYSPFLYFIVLFLACQYFSDLVGYGLTLLALLVYIVKHFYYSPAWLYNGTELHYLVLFTVACLFSVTIAHVVAREKASRTRAEELLAELKVSHEQLKKYSAQAEELATVRERNRLARDIHDTLGHYLTVVIVQLEKAQVFRAKKPQEADQAVTDARRLASEALQDVRSSVSTLRSKQEQQSLTSSIMALVEHIQSDQCSVEFHIEGDEESFSQQRRQVLYRIIQEGLTNIQKHAQANHIWLQLCFGEQTVTLLLRDDGQGLPTKQAERANGYGLQGLRERLEFVGGSLEITSAPGTGTSLRVTMPKHELIPIDFKGEK